MHIKLSLVRGEFSGIKRGWGVSFDSDKYDVLYDGDLNIEYERKIRFIVIIISLLMSPLLGHRPSSCAIGQRINFSMDVVKGLCYSFGDKAPV
jgi:hypothetical protein